METVEFLPRPKPIDAIARPSGREFRAAQQRHEERRERRIVTKTRSAARSTSQWVVVSDEEKCSGSQPLRE